MCACECFFPPPLFLFSFFQLDAKKGLECTRGDLEHVQLVLASVVSEASTSSDPDALAMRQRVVLLGAQHTSIYYVNYYLCVGILAYDPGALAMRQRVRLLGMLRVTFFFFFFFFPCVS